MKNYKRTDLAMEAYEMWTESAAEESRLKGVKAEEFDVDGYHVHKVEILDEDGERELNKPKGLYVTVDITNYFKKEENSFQKAVKVISDQIREMRKELLNGSTLVVGLGNRYITPDAIGPKTVESVMVTRHLIEVMPNEFAAFRPVAALSPGVLGLTGVETGEIVQGVADKIKPTAVIAIDALASRRISRLCKTVQISNTGIVPGAGVGNTRFALSKDSLGAKVIAVGIPTVVDAVTLASDIAEEAGAGKLDVDALQKSAGQLIVTPKDIDSTIEDTAKVIGYAINMAVHDNLQIGDIDMFLS